MAENPYKTSFADTIAARLMALAVFALCLAALGYLHRDDLFPRQPADTTIQTNPAFLECRQIRVGHVDKMLQEGVIDTVKYDRFKERALAYCAAEFPPGH